MAHTVAEIEAVLVEASKADNLSDWDRDFIEDNLKRIAEFGDDTAFTAKQWEQVQRIEDRYVTRKAGHNSGIGGIAGDALTQFLERVERLEEEKAEIAADIKSVFDSAKGQGFDVKIMRQLLRLRKMEAADRQETHQLLELYGRATGLDIFS